MTAASVDALVVRLRTRLAHEQLGPGERLGDERSLADSLGVTRTQLRPALDRLEAEGLVRRTIGRGGGVRVTDGRIERNLNTIEGLPDIARYQGFHVDTRVLRVELGTADARERRRLRLPEGAAVHRLSRLRLADGRPLSLEESSLPADLFPGLGTADLGSLYRTLRTVYGVTPQYSDETLELTFAEPEQAAHLQVEPGSPLVHVQRVATGTAGRPIEAAHEHFVGGRMRFHLRKYGYVHPADPAPAP